jgi:hypothetical protein
VILLGNSDSYIEHLREIVGRTRGGVTSINDVPYRAGGVLFVHIAHPSGGNSHFGAFIRGEGRPGEKMKQTVDALGVRKLAPSLTARKRIVAQAIRTSRRNPGKRPWS